MKLVELKKLKEETVYKRILDELRLKGLENIYIKRTEQIDYLDIIINLLDFLEKNRDVVKKLNNDMFENIIVICIDEILESIGLEIISEDQIEKIIKLLKNSILIKKVTKTLYKQIKDIIKKINCCGNTVEFV